MFFLISGLILMSYITDVLQKQQVLKHFFLTGEDEMVKSVFSQVHGSVSFTVNITTSLSSRSPYQQNIYLDSI